RSPRSNRAYAGSVNIMEVSKAELHWAAVLVLLCLSGPLIPQSTGTVGEHSRALERSGQLLLERGVLLYRRDAAADKREALSLFLRAAEDFKAGGAAGKQATAMLLAGFASKSLSEDREALGYFKRDRKSTRLNSSHLGISY